MAADERAGEALEQIKQFQAEKREVWA
jgi:hypothetical protein